MRNGILISLYSLALAAGVVCAQDPQPDNKDKDKPAITITPAPTDKDKSITITPSPNQTPTGTMAPHAGSGDCGCNNSGGMGGCSFGGCGSCGCGSGGYSPAGSTWFEGGGGFDNSNGSGSHIWASAEYMLTWMKNGPTPGPLVTSTGNPGTLGTSGALGQSGTTILYNPSGLNDGTFQSTRLTVGGWLNQDHTFGAEVSGFVTEQRSTSFAIGSAGSPPVYIPAFDTARNAESALVVADPKLNVTGNVLWASETRLWGLETNGLMAVCSGCNYQVDFIAGFRYADLSESLGLAYNSETLPIAGSPGQYTTSFVDQFHTRNQFYGGQIGAKASWVWNFVSLDVTGKLALGDTDSTVGVNGTITQSGTGPTPGTFPGGLFSQPSNIGSQSHDNFSVVPEIDIKLGCEIVPGVRAFIGYDFLYWSQVARPGDEVNRNVNLTQSNVFGTGTLNGAANPVPVFKPTDFWANSISFGLEIHY